jgi:phosphate transport system ATP-binding protein
MLHDRQLVREKTKCTQKGAETAGADPAPIMSVRGLSLASRGRPLIHDVSFDLFPKEVLAFVGREGGGKSMLLRSLARMEQLGRSPARIGKILFQGEDLLNPKTDLPLFRRHLALVAQETNPFPLSIWDNIAYGIKLNRLANSKGLIADLIEASLCRAQLWDVVKDQLHTTMGTDLNGAQRRQLCIARALALDPKVMLIDRAASAGDRMSFVLTRDLVTELRKSMAIVLVPQSLENAAHMADRVAFCNKGRIVELDTAEMIFTNARDPETRAFLEQSTYM